MQGSSVPDRELLDAAALCGHLLGEGSVHALLAEHHHRLFPDEMFADLFPTNRDRPSVPADVIATVMVLQSLEGLSDREAVRALDYRDGYKAHVATEVLGDSAYGADEFRSHLKNNKMTAVIKPPPLRPAVTGGFSLDDFAIDLDAGTVTCPEEITPTPAPRAPLLSTVLDATSTRGAPSSPL